MKVVSILLLCAAAAAQGTPLERANAAMDAHDYEAAVKLLVPLAAQHPKDARIAYDLGLAQDALDQASPAEASYRAAISDDAAYLDPHVALGLMLARNGKLGEARTELDAVRKVASDDAGLKARAFRALARIDEKARPAEARDELLEALKLTPETPEDILLGAELAEGANNGAAAAEEAYRRFLAKQPNDPAATAELASLLTRQSRAEEAELLLTDALKAHPGDTALTVQLAAIYGKAGKLAQAVPLVAALYTANPGNAPVAELLAGLYLDTEDYAHAEPWLAKLCVQQPRNVQLQAEWGRALLHLKRFPEAQQVLARAVAQPSLFPAAADLGNAAGDLAFAASTNGDPRECLRALEIRATVLPTSAPTLFLKAISLDKLHQVKLAMEAYNLFLAASQGAYPDEEFEARHRLIALEHMK